MLSVVLAFIALCLIVDALAWLSVGLAMGRWPTSRPVAAWPFVWAVRAILKPRRRFL